MSNKDVAKIVVGIVGLTYVGASVKDSENIQDYEGYVENASEAIGKIPLIESFNLITESGDSIVTESGDPIIVKDPISYEIEFQSRPEIAIVSTINDR